MKGMDEVIKYYNENQDELEISYIRKIGNDYYVIHKSMQGIEFDMGFYEWLFNPKFKALKIFEIDNISLNLLTRGNCEPREIIEYLSNQIKEKQANEN